MAISRVHALTHHLPQKVKIIAFGLTGQVSMGMDSENTQVKVSFYEKQWYTNRLIEKSVIDTNKKRLFG